MRLYGRPLGRLYPLVVYNAVAYNAVASWLVVLVGLGFAGRSVTLTHLSGCPDLNGLVNYLLHRGGSPRQVVLIA